MDRKFFFFDIDGTLIAGSYDNGVVLPSTHLALEQLRHDGHVLAIATGRAYIMAIGILRDLGMEHMVCDGGNGIVANGQLVDVEPLDRNAVCRLISECEAAGFPWALQKELPVPCVSRDLRFDEATGHRYITSIVEPDLRPEDCAQVYKVYIACPPGEEKALPTLRELPWCRFEDAFFFVEPCDKSRGIRRLVKQLGGEPKDVVVFGDADNDLSMFCPEWTSIAMGNACEALKARADYVTDSCYKDGIYNACRHFGWVR